MIHIDTKKKLSIKSSRVTLKDVAATAGVSTGTVSRVLNGQKYISEKTREKVLSAIKRLNYHPHAIAKRLVTGRTNVIRLYMIQEYPILKSTWGVYLEIIEGALEVTRKNGYQLELDVCSIDDLKNKNLIAEDANMKSFDGVLLLGSWPLDYSTISELIRNNLPYMIINTKVPGQILNEVEIDNKESIIRAIDYLYQLGHRRIALISGPSKQQNMADRIDGYREGLKLHQLEQPDDYYIESDFTIEGGYQAFNQLFSLTQRPTAIVCGNDHMAAGVIRAAADKGLTIPTECSVIGFDNHEIARVTKPTLTTISPPLKNLGSISAKRLLLMLEGGETYYGRLVLPCELIVRESTNKPQCGG